MTCSAHMTDMGPTEGAVHVTRGAQLSGHMAHQQPSRAATINTAPALAWHAAHGMRGGEGSCFSECHSSGVGGAETINTTHFIGAVYGVERIMGRTANPVIATY